jgi:hypothetical protein
MRYISTSLQLTIDQFFSPKKPTDISGLFHNIFIMIKPSTRKKSTTKISKKNEEKQKFDDSISFYVQSSTHFQVLYFLICPFHIFCRTSQFIYMFCSFFFFFIYLLLCPKDDEVNIEYLSLFLRGYSVPVWSRRD